MNRHLVAPQNSASLTSTCTHTRTQDSCDSSLVKLHQCLKRRWPCEGEDERERERERWRSVYFKDRRPSTPRSTRILTLHFLNTLWERSVIKTIRQSPRSALIYYKPAEWPSDFKTTFPLRPWSNVIRTLLNTLSINNRGIYFSNHPGL